MVFSQGSTVYVKAGCNTRYIGCVFVYKSIHGGVAENTVRTESKFPSGNLFFVITVEKFQIPEYTTVAILPQAPVTMLILPLT